MTLDSLLRSGTRRLTAVLLATLATGLIAAACASSSKAKPATPAPTPATAPAPSAPPASAPAARPAAPAPAPTAAAAAATPAAGAPAAAAAPAGAPAAGGRRGGGPPAPPPVPPPAVMPAPVKATVSMTKPSPDPRVGLKAGPWDAGQAAWNLQLISTTPPTDKSLGATHSDLAFSGKYVIQANYNGFQVFDTTTPSKPTMVMEYVCPASQDDVSVYKNLLFLSAEAPTARLDCGIQGVQDAVNGVSKDRIRGIRIFDIADPKRPKYVGNVQTCRGSHTHTLAVDPKDKDNVYIYISGTSAVRSADELPGCLDGPIEDPNTVRFRIEVIKIPIAAPEKAAIVSSPRIFQGLLPAPVNAERNAIAAAERGRGAGAAGAPGAGPAGAPGARGAGVAGAPGAVPPTPPAGAQANAAAGGAAGAGAGGRGGRGGAPAVPTGPNQCHDITVYPAVGLAGGACAGAGLLLDIRDVAHPVRIDQVYDPNMSFWHSATFSNDGSKVLFSDEWGGGNAPRCRDTDKMEWGADALFTIVNGKMQFHTYYKMPAAQTAFENCVAHNGSLIPIPGRDVMVQAWYQGGLSIFDWTDVAHPQEIAYFDRGPMDGARLDLSGSWSAYWYNGAIYSSEIKRGLDIFELLPSGLITQNEIDAAKTVKFEYLNVQGQQQFVWPASFPLVRAYLDQLERSKGLAAANVTAARTALASAERLSGGARRTALTQLATKITADAAGAADQAKVKTTAAAVTDLANAR